MFGINEGDYVVERSTYGWHLHKAVKVSDKRVTVHRYGTREGHLRREDIVFSGAHEPAKRLLEQLVSSRALMTQEQNEAAIRQSKREDGLIAAANSQPQT